MGDKLRLRVGIMGGTFDPVHYGHLFIAECSRHRFNLGKVLFIPSGRPAHKTRNDILDPFHRVEMVSLAIESNPFFELSTVEVDRPGPTYAVDTLDRLHRAANDGDEFFFITGADAILEILTWKDVSKIFDLCSFIAVTRPGYSLEAMTAVLRDLTEEQKSRIYIHETTGILVSSTDIRERAGSGEPIKYLLPQSVVEYIEQKGLYRKK